MRKLAVSMSLLGLVALVGLPPGVAGATKGPARKYVVVYADGASLAEGRAAVRAVGGTIVRENVHVGVATVRTTNRNFLVGVSRQPALLSAARNVPIGYTPNLRPKMSVERDLTVSGSAIRTSRELAAVTEASDLAAEPLSNLTWGLDMIDATVTGSYAVEMGDPGVLVGIMDTGIDAHHPDLAATVDVGLSRVFTTDIPLVDGPCEEEPDQSCEDPPDIDDGGHGTHVAGTVAAAYNGFGLAGVAPGVTLVNLAAAQDSGFFFLQPTVDAWTYAADIGVDVINHSFFTDPWWMNCRNNPADSRAAKMEQRTIIAATQRALNYAHAHDVTLIGSIGNMHTDLGHPTVDDISPDFPPGIAYHREVDNSCLVLPTEGNHVASVVALGPSGRKAYYSDYGIEQAFVSAPGGDRRDFFGTPQYNAPENRILSTYPHDLAVEQGLVGESCNRLTPLVVVYKTRIPAQCGVYVYLQGTSMASPHAAGVAALIVSANGVSDGAGGLTMDPDEVTSILADTATETPCPAMNPFHYPDPDLPPEFDAFCEGDLEFNGFYGFGIVNALAAVS